MTKRWSSTRSLDGNAKRSASKEKRREQQFLLREQLEQEEAELQSTTTPGDKNG